MIPNTTRTRYTPIYVGDFYYKIQDLLGSGFSSKVYRGNRTSIPDQEVAVKVINMNNITEQINRLLLESELQTLEEMKGCSNILTVFDIIRPNTNRSIAAGANNRDRSMSVVCSPMGTKGAKNTKRSNYCGENNLQKTVNNSKNSVGLSGSADISNAIMHMQQPLPHTYIITELCKSDLSQKLNPKIGYIVAEKYIRQLLIGFKELFEHGIVHRDLKPANLFIDANNNLKIGDFGFAIRIEEAHRQSKYNIGSPLYMAPQTLRRNSYTHQSDIWAIGIIIYEMLVGETPWKADNQAMLYQQIRTKSIDELLKDVTDSIIPIPVKSLIKKMLKFDKKDRIKGIDLVNHEFLIKNRKNKSTASHSKSVIVDSLPEKQIQKQNIEKSAKVKKTSQMQMNLRGKKNQNFNFPNQNTISNDRKTVQREEKHAKIGWQTSKKRQNLEQEDIARGRSNTFGEKSSPTPKNNNRPSEIRNKISEFTIIPKTTKANIVEQFPRTNKNNNVSLYQANYFQAKKNKRSSECQKQLEDEKQSTNQTNAVDDFQEKSVQKIQITEKYHKSSNATYKTMHTATAIKTVQTINTPKSNANHNINGDNDSRQQEIKSQGQVDEKKNQQQQKSGQKEQEQQKNNVIDKQQVKNITKTLVHYVHICRLLYKIVQRVNKCQENGFQLTISAFNTLNTKILTCGNKTSSHQQQQKKGGIKFFNGGGGIKRIPATPNSNQSANKSNSQQIYLAEIQKLRKSYCNIIVRLLFKTKNMEKNNFLNLPVETLTQYSGKNDFKKIKKVCNDYIERYSNSSQFRIHWLRRQEPNYSNAITNTTNIIKLLWPELCLNKNNEEIILLDYLLYARGILQDLMNRQKGVNNGLKEIKQDIYYNNQHRDKLEKKFEALYNDQSNSKIQDYVDSQPTKPTLQKFKEVISKAKKICLIGSAKN